MKNSLNPAVLRTVNQCNFNKFSNAVHANRVLDEHCMFFVLEGEWEIWQDGEPYTVKKDDMIFLMRGRHHYGLIPSSPVVRTCFIHPAADAADKLIDEEETPPVLRTTARRLSYSIRLSTARGIRPLKDSLKKSFSCIIRMIPISVRKSAEIFCCCFPKCRR